MNKPLFTDEELTKFYSKYVHNTEQFNKEILAKSLSKSSEQDSKSHKPSITLSNIKYFKVYKSPGYPVSPRMMKKLISEAYQSTKGIMEQDRSEFNVLRKSSN